MALSSSFIRVAVLEAGGEHVLVEGKLTHKINTESSLWSLEPGKCILVSMASARVPGGESAHHAALQVVCVGPHFVRTTASVAGAPHQAL